MTLPLPSMVAPLVNKMGKIIPPWNSWFQQFSQPAPAVQNISASPFTANAIGNAVLTGAVTITLTRGPIAISLNGERIIPIGIGDTLSWTGPATVQFLG